MKSQIKALESENTIVLKKGDSIINIQKQSQPELFDKISKLIRDNNLEELATQFTDIKEYIERYAGEDFEVIGGDIIIKTTGDRVPECIVKKLSEMSKEGVDYKPLVRFWDKLKYNPSENSREQLYNFMLHNNIPLTPDGDIVVEKGVKQDGEILVDCHTGNINNSIGMIVSMDRNKVDNNPNQTCSRGLHVAPPDYVRDWYSDSIVVECVVNPVDVVSVPVDYDNKKMRVCKYHVIGLAPKSQEKVSIKGYDELMKNSPLPQLNPKTLIQKDSRGGYEVTSTPVSIDDILSKMTAREVVNYVFSKTGEWIVDIDNPSKLKNKKGIVKKAKKMLSSLSEKREVSFEIMTARQIVRFVENDLGIILTKALIPRRKQVIKKALEVYADKNVNIIY